MELAWKRFNEKGEEEEWRNRTPVCLGVGGGEGVCFAVMFMGCLSMRPERHQGQVLHSARRQARSRASEQPWAMASDVPDVLRGSGPWDAFVCRFHDLLAAAQWAPFAAVTEGALGSHRDALPHPALF